MSPGIFRIGPFIASLCFYIHADLAKIVIKYLNRLKSGALGRGLSQV
jgi:hypothetical protein